MAAINYITRKTNKQFFFEVQLNWLAKKRGILHAHDVSGALHVATPPQFGGEGKEWGPEHLFLGSVSSCFMTTYLVFAKKLDFSITHFECNAIGQIELIENKYKFTHINLYPKVYVAGESLREKAGLAMQKTQKYCLVANSVNAEVIYHGEVLTEPLPSEKLADTSLKTPSFSLTEAKEIGDRIGIDFTKYKLEEFRRGLEVEMEHGKAIPETNITNNNVYITAKIAWAHLHELPDYYTRLDKMEKEAETELQR
jgi:organic hydroperoxide reductase OsmC/OhrA